MQDFNLGKAVAFARPDGWQICERQTKPKLLIHVVRVMKITTIILLTACLQVSAKGYSQNITLSETNTPLEQVFSKIKQQSGFTFWYNDAVLKKAKRVNVQLKDVSLEEALSIIFSEQPLSYNIVDKIIVVKEKRFASINSEEVAAAALLPIDITGKVLNENGAPVEGVTVTIKGTSTSTNTNSNGEFSLSSVDQDAILVFTHVSMETFELKVSGKRELLVKLKAKISELGGVEIVSTGYQEVSKERATGSYTKIDSALYHREVGTNLIARLDGLVNGAQVLKKGGGGGFLIRGISTISSSLQPLIILDNFPYNGDILNINPNDVESISFLKDAAAASIWGTQAANGVIVVTTKKGRYNQPFRLSINSNITIQEKPNLYYFPQMATSDFIDVEEFLFDKNFYTSHIANPRLYVISPVVEILNKKKNGTISPEEANTQINSLRGLDVRNDYEKHVLRTGLNLQNYLNFSGGTHLLSYNFSLGYDRNQTGIKGPGSYNRYTLNSNTNFKPHKLLELTAGLTYSQGISKGDGLTYPIIPGGSNATFSKSVLYPYAELADANGNHLAVPFGYGRAYADNPGSNQLLDWHYRPLDELNLADNTAKRLYSLLNLGANIRITSWLNADIKYQYSQQTETVRHLHDLESYFTRDNINRFTDPSTLQKAIPMGSILDLSNSELLSNSIRGQLNVKKSWVGHHELTALLAAEAREIRNKMNSNRVYGYDDDILAYSNTTDYNTNYSIYTGGTSRVPNNLSISELIDRSASFLGNISYAYKRRYTIYASARKDGANIFGVKTNNKWKPLWSTGVSWDLSKESFYHINWLTALRLRVSYGYTGNSNNTIPAFLTMFYQPFLNIYTGSPSASIALPPNPDLRWEETRTLNLGIDFSALQNRISGNIEWYQKRSTDVIANSPIDYTTGVVTATKNAANLYTKGIDIQLNSNNLIGVIKWATTFNFSYAKSIVTKFYDNQIKGIPGPVSINPNEGKMAWGLYAYRWAGLDPITGDPQGYLNGAISKNYNGIINDSFQHHILLGSSVPLYFGNFLNSLSWKGFSLSANFSYKFSYYFRKPTINYRKLVNNWEGHPDYKTRWQKQGDELITTVPSFTYPTNAFRDQFYAQSEVNVEKGDHMRLQDVRISYSFFDQILKRLPINNLQLYLYAGNLNIMIWKSNKSGLDPDYTGNLLTLPPSRTWAFGINVGFK